MEKIKQIIEEFFKKIGFTKLEIDIKKDNSLKDRELLNINIKADSEEADFFIKEGAIGLSALQHLLRVLIYRKDLSHSFLVLDINQYKKKREKYLTDLAVKTAEKVKKTKKAITLEPMSAYERRFIHLELAEQSDIVTESIGQEPERRLVVRLYP